VIAATARLLLVGVCGLALWHLAGVGRPYDRAVAHLVAFALHANNWDASVESPQAGVAQGLSLRCVRRYPDHILAGTVPLTWHHLNTVTSGFIVLLALLAASGLRAAQNGRPPRAALVRAAVALAALLGFQALGVYLVIAGSLPEGAPVLQQAGGLIETGCTVLLPALLWAGAVFGGRGPTRRAAETPQERRPRTAGAPRSSRARR
jgi:hypothetical protein